MNHNTLPTDDVVNPEAWAEASSVEDYQYIDNNPFDEDTVRHYVDYIGRYQLLTKEDEQRLGALISDGQTAEAALDSDLMFSPNQIYKLLQTVESGSKAHKTFVQANLRLVVHEAKKYHTTSLAFLDLIQEGNKGLMRAVDLFDYRKGFKFSTYAVNWINEQITRAIASKGRVIRLSGYASTMEYNLRASEARLVVALGRRATDDELAQDMNIDPSKVPEIRRNGRIEPISLETERFSNGPSSAYDTPAPVSNYVADPDALIQFDENLDREQKKAFVDKLLARLNERERIILRMCFGIDDNVERSNAEVAEYFNLTRERIRQIKVRALKKLRDPLYVGHINPEELRDMLG